MAVRTGDPLIEVTTKAGLTVIEQGSNEIQQKLTSNIAYLCLILADISFHYQNRT